MDDSLLILGRQPALGLAELEGLYDSRVIIPLGPRAASLSLPTKQVDFKRFGGSTRLAKIITKVPSQNWKIIEKQLAETVVNLSSSLPEGKLKLGLSVFDLPISTGKINAAGLTLKKIVRSKTSRSVRLVPNPEQELNTAQVLHNNLTGPTGVELLIIAIPGDQTVIAHTLAVQDIASYTMRDRSRPKRDARVGMLPPKLAQIIINLAAGQNSSDGDTVLDPFCGTGVILQEACLMSYRTYGTDLEPRMIEFSQNNLEWLNQNHMVNPTENHLEVGDATNHKWQSPINFVASETYLGRPFTSQPDLELLGKTSSECNLIISKFLKNIHSQIESGTRLCLAVPSWQTAKNKFKHLPLVDQIEDLGYNRVSFEHVRDEDLIYYRENQIVARQLLVLTRK